MTKRQKFVLGSVLLATGFFAIQFLDFSYRYSSIGGFILFSLLVSFFAKEGLGRNATLLTLVLPVFFAAGTQLFYLGLENSGFFTSLSPTLRLGLRLILVTAYTLGAYALFLTSNIYTVAAARTIQLLRAAHAVGFLLTLVVAFFIFNAIFSLRLDFWVNGLVAVLASTPLFLQGFWSIDLEHTVSKNVLYTSIGLSLLVGQMAAMLSFWPITVVVGSLAVTTVLYAGLGLGQANLQQRLFEKTIREYLIVGAVVFATMFLTASWGG